MSKQSVEIFFAGKNFTIPDQQRGYAWEQRHVDEFLSDIENALESGVNYYLGVFILSQASSAKPIYVVEGQQRLITLTMVLDRFIDALQNQDVCNAMRSSYVRHPLSGRKLKLCGKNSQFFESMLDKQNPTPSSVEQKRLKNAYQYIDRKVQSLEKLEDQGLIIKWLTAITQMELLEFIERDEGKAISMFHTISNRGIPLTKIDTIRNLLIYYSSCYLGGKLDQFVVQQFGKVYQELDNMEHLTSKTECSSQNADNESFREDEGVRYHYLAFDTTPFGVDSCVDYGASSELVLECFLRPALQKLSADSARLKAFIEVYTKDLVRFFKSE